MFVPTTGVKSSSKVSTTLATLEEVMKGHVVQKKYTRRSNGSEADKLHSTLTCAHQLEKIFIVAAIKPSASKVFHRLPRDEETPKHNYGGFGAWSQTHLMSGAMLPLQDYFIDFLVFVGLAPYQLIPQAYCLLSGLFIFYVAKGWASPSPVEILYFYELVSVPKKGDKLKDSFFTLRAHPANEGPVPFDFQKNVKEYHHQFFFSSGFQANERSKLLTEWVKIPLMHRTAPTQLFLQHPKVFSTYKKDGLNVGDLVTTAHWRRAKLITENQSVDDFNLSKVLCPNVRSPDSEKALRADIIASVEDRYKKYLFRREQELAYIKVQAAAGRVLRIEAGKEQATFRPKLPFSVPNTGAPDASTPGSGKSPLTVHHVPSVQDYSGCRLVEFDERLHRFRMPLFRWGDHAKGFYFSNLGHFLGQSWMGSGPPTPITLDYLAYLSSSWFLPSDSFLGDDDTSLFMYAFARQN
uniref:Uncharacterized protein n=1 Tax=Cannabis sativa TaxID=3483 RepID=A0A803P2T7_CANSA